LNLTEWIVLALVSEAPTHGWAIVRAFRPGGAIGTIWVTTGPLVYRAISRLEDAALIRSAGTATGRGPGRVILEVEPGGLEQLGEWLMRPVDHIRDLRTELLVKLVLLDRRGLDRDLLVRRQLERIQPIATALASRPLARSTIDEVIDLWRATSAEAALRFLEALLVEAADGPEAVRLPQGGATMPEDAPTL